MPTIHYSKTSYSFIIIGCMALSILGIGISYLYQWGNSPIPLTATIIIEIIFIGIILLMYQLKITIDDSKISILLGIGLIKKSILLKNIAITSMKKVSIPWYYGIGIRLTPYGMLYNVQPGPALLIHSKNNKRSILVGTKDAYKLMDIIQQLSKQN